MPHYLLETGATSEAHLDRALSLIGPRFPEVVVEQRYTAREIDRNEMWACRAPNAAHIQRWAAAAQLEVRSLRHVDADGTARVRPLNGHGRDRPSRQRSRAIDTPGGDKR